MINLKIKKNELYKDEVWIDMMKSEDVIHLRQYFSIPDTLPDGVLRILFRINKTMPSWIEYKNQRIHFHHCIFRTLRDSENDHYVLRFELRPTKSPDDFIDIPISKDHMSKKKIVLKLIEQLILRIKNDRRSIEKRKRIERIDKLIKKRGVQKRGVQILDSLKRELKESIANAEHITTSVAENWSPDWKGDPDDPQRWKGW